MSSDIADMKATGAQAASDESDVQRRQATFNGFTAFFCDWAVHRTIVDRLNSTRAEFAGTAAISAHLFEENGSTSIGGYRLQSRRSYLLDIKDDELMVLFPDSRPFVRLRNAILQRIGHPCGADSYSGRLLVAGPDCFIETWRVIGPRKDYQSVARFRRL